MFKNFILACILFIIYQLVLEEFTGLRSKIRSKLSKGLYIFIVCISCSFICILILFFTNFDTCIPQVIVIPLGLVLLSNHRYSKLISDKNSSI
ncbi:hypothetical protein [Oceanirhabdus sp. W0125-5]|uniref:hypothetical protein n=1 Tax=Oceanirhabdus sp. W0125-5 TaxID=2999116 RepID=UPI0022F2C20A|nr:hypothetical protein [Oceanirhabdus sp. W0125-5]WBW97669.1 hypothetical protein OW730_02505 [Oceanirhabdus sp. W0125-5]